MSGPVDTEVNADGTFNISFDFVYAGDWDLPCGHVGGEWSLGGQFQNIQPSEY